MKNKLLIFVIGLVAISAGVYFYTYKGHRDIATEEAHFEVTVADLSKEFTANDSLANSKYADKTIQIEGRVTGIDLPSKTLMIDEKLSAVFTNPPTNITLQQTIKIKGRFVGYDDLLEEFKLDQATKQDQY